jgi:hypothetical protein
VIADKDYAAAVPIDAFHAVPDSAFARNAYIIESGHRASSVIGYTTGVLQVLESVTTPNPLSASQLFFKALDSFVNYFITAAVRTNDLMTKTDLSARPTDATRTCCSHRRRSAQDSGSYASFAGNPIVVIYCHKVA